MNAAKLRSTIVGVQKRAILERAIMRFVYDGGEKLRRVELRMAIVIWSVDEKKRRDRTTCNY